MAEQRYYTGLNGLPRIKRVRNRYRSPSDPEDVHDQSAKYLCAVIEEMSIHPDLKWAAHLLNAKLWGFGLCEQEPVGDGKSIFTIDYQVLAETFRARAAKKKRN
jgi:hypothetical protein